MVEVILSVCKKVFVFSMLVFILANAIAVHCCADSTIAQVTQGSLCTFIVKTDGSVLSSGFNDGGVLADGTTTDRCVFGPTMISNCCKVSIGSVNGIALKNDGSLWTWGNNDFGQRGYDASGITLGQVPTLANITDIYCTAQCSCFAIKDDGSVWSWGSNYYGSLGDGTDIQRATPVQVAGLPPIVSIVSSGTYTLALDNSGYVWAWGRNNFGQLGDGTTIDSKIPKKVPIDHVKAISVGGQFSAALREDGTVWMWGCYDDSSNSIQKAPVQISGLSGVVGISAYDGLMAVTSDGTVWAVGYVDPTILGDGQDHSVLYGNDGATVEGKWQKVAIDNAAFVSDGNNFFVLKNDGSLWGWGRNIEGGLGIGRFDSQSRNGYWGIYLPNRIITEPGATPLPVEGGVFKPTKSPYVSPVLTPSPVINASPNDTTATSSVNLSISPSAEAGPTPVSSTAAVPEAPAVSVAPTHSSSATPAGVVSPEPSGTESPGFDISSMAVVFGVLLAMYGLGRLRKMR